VTKTTVQAASRQELSIVCILLLLPAGAFLVWQGMPLGETPPEHAGPPMQALSPDRFANLVASVALYSDSSLSQVLVVGTYPLEIVEAEQWLQQNRNLCGAQLEKAAHPQKWDAGIQPLLVFPDVLIRLDSDLHRITDLENALLAQQADAMNAVQPLRADRGSGRFERCWRGATSYGIPKESALQYETALKTVLNDGAWRGHGS
jgi:hypothetical protein